MSTLFHARAQAHEHFIEQFGVVTAVGGLILRFLHLRSRDELHGLGDLGRAFDRLDASADVAGACHVVKFEISDPTYFQLPLKSASADLRSSTVLSRDFSLAILSSRASLRV